MDDHRAILSDMGADVHRTCRVGVTGRRNAPMESKSKQSGSRTTKSKFSVPAFNLQGLSVSSTSTQSARRPDVGRCQLLQTKTVSTDNVGDVSISFYKVPSAANTNPFIQFLLVARMHHDETKTLLGEFTLETNALMPQLRYCVLYDRHNIHYTMSDSGETLPDGFAATICKRAAVIFGETKKTS